MRILLLHWGTRGGGPQLQAHIGQALIDLDDVDLLVSYDNLSECAKELTNLRVPSFRIGRSGISGRSRLVMRGLMQPFDAVRLLMFCRKQRVDVLYEVMDHPFQLAPKLLLRMAGVRVLGSVHDATRHPGEESHLLDAISRLSMRSSSGIMTYSSAVAAELCERRVLPGHRIFQTVHGAFGLVSGPRTHPGIASEFIVGFFGRIERYKGLARFLSAVELLQLRGLRVIPRIDGRGPLSPREEALIEATRATHNAGWVDEERIQQTVESYDILALPYDEASQSGVLGFALSSGTPCVSTPVGGLGEQVSESGAGIVTETMSVEDFADAIQRVMGDPELYGELSKQGVASARGGYSWMRVANDVKNAAIALSDESVPRR